MFMLCLCYTFAIEALSKDFLSNWISNNVNGFIIGFPPVLCLCYVYVVPVLYLHYACVSFDDCIIHLFKVFNLLT